VSLSLSFSTFLRFTRGKLRGINRFDGLRYFKQKD